MVADINDLAGDLASGKVSPSDVAPIRTFQKDGATFSLDNRRLLAASAAGTKVNTIPATAAEIASEAGRKMTTTTNGQFVKVRGINE